MEYGMTVSIIWVESSKNKSDILTRVSSKWIQAQRPGAVVGSGACIAVSGPEEENIIRGIHGKHHLGLDRTFYLVK